MRLLILEVLSNPLLLGWGHSGDVTADFAPVVGHLTQRFVKSPVFPTLPRGGGVGHEIDKCIMKIKTLELHMLCIQSCCISKLSLMLELELKLRQ